MYRQLPEEKSIQEKKRCEMKLSGKHWLLALVIFTVFVALSGCGRKDDGPVSMKGYASGVEAATEEETQAEESSLYTVSGVDTTLSTMTFLNIDTGRYEQYSYTDGTIFKDRHGSLISAASMVPGKVVTLTLRDKDLILEKVEQSADAWEMDDIGKFSYNEEDKIFTIGDTKYSYDEELQVFSGDAAIELSAVTGQDTLRIQGIDRKVLSVSVTTGHGVIQLVNTQALEGGWLSLNHKNYYKITENMQLEVPEGTYELTVAGNGYGGSTEVAVTRNEQTSVDVDSIKGEDPKYCTLTFAVDVAGALMYIDGSQVDYTQPLQLQYGIHSIQITADGYDTWSKRLYVNSPEAQIEIALSGDDTGSTETESTETAGNEENTTVEHKHSDSTSNSSGTNSSSGSSSSDSDAYRKALSEIIDTLTSNNNSSTSTLNQVVNSLTN
jgi:predicted small lipoprotein YifL